MRSREFFVLTGALALLALGGLAVVGREAFAEAQPPSPGEGAEPALPDRNPAADLSALPDVEKGSLPAPAAVASGEKRGEPTDTAGWTKGVVMGDIQLATSILDRIQSIRIEVVEVRNPITRDGKVQLPTRLVVPVKLGRGTPIFEVRDIPFSEYPYSVSVVSPGLNGSHAMVTIDARTPLANSLMLAITPGTPLSVLLRDQDQNPFTGVDLVLLPIGDPAGRPTHKGTTDNFGSFVADDMLTGDYQVFVTQGGLPLLEPQTMTVQRGSLTRVTGQSYQLTIERGVPVQVKVHDRAYYPYVDAKVTATATDRIKLTVRETTTDQQGVASFAHLQPGTWQITVTKDKYYLWDQQVTVKPFQDPLQLDVTLVPIRQ